MIAAFALTVHTLVDNKYLGHFIVILYYVADIFMAALGYDHHLYAFASEPQVVYSDMNRYGHFLAAVRWFQLYWAAASVLLLVAARLFWVRGTEAHWKVRWAIARQRWTRPVAATTAIAAVVLVATGAWIFYNTNILNPYRNEWTREELRAQYEKAFKPLSAKPQPKIVGVKVAADIFPYEHRAQFKGTFTLKNKSA